MNSSSRGVRLAATIVSAVLATASIAACSDQPVPDALAPGIPPAAATVAPGGAGTYVGEAVNALRTPVEVRVTIGADLTAAPGQNAAAAAAYLRQVATLLDLPVPEVRFVTVEIDNTGEIDVVDLPGNIDVLDAAGRGANFRPAYDVVRENLELLTATSPAFEEGRTLLQRLVVRQGEVRPGKIETVPYVSRDVLADVAQVIVNGSLARRSAE